jgi:excinuclease ABC subunit C
LHLIQRIRDEAHRFAVTFHRTRRTRRELASELLEVPGVGERTARKLLEHFGSLSKLKSVSEAELSQIVTQKQAIRIMEFLAKDNVKLT